MCAGSVCAFFGNGNRGGLRCKPEEQACTFQATRVYPKQARAAANASSAGIKTNVLPTQRSDPSPPRDTLFTTGTISHDVTSDCSVETSMRVSPTSSVDVLLPDLEVRIALALVLEDSVSLNKPPVAPSRFSCSGSNQSRLHDQNPKSWAQEGGSGRRCIER